MDIQDVHTQINFISGEQKKRICKSYENRIFQDVF